MNNTRTIAISILLTASAIIMTNCGESTGKPSTNNPSLIVIEGAKNVNYSNVNGIEQVMYYIDAEYPAKDHIEHISSMLHDLGWNPVDTNLFFPEERNSHAVGWVSKENSQARFKLWQGDWKNEHDDLVRYLLSYSSQISEDENLTTLSIAGIYSKKEAAEKAKRKARKTMSPNKAL